MVTMNHSLILFTIAVSLLSFRVVDTEKKTCDTRGCSAEFDKKPLLTELTGIADGSRLSIVKSIGTDYKLFGIQLLSDTSGVVVNVIIDKYRDPNRITTEIFEEWLKGAGLNPVTWRTLIDVLRNINLHSLADEVTSILEHRSQASRDKSALFHDVETTPIIQPKDATTDQGEDNGEFGSIIHIDQVSGDESQAQSHIDSTNRTRIEDSTRFLAPVIVMLLIIMIIILIVYFCCVPTNPINRYARYLRGRYNIPSVAPQDKWPMLKVNRYYINLAVIKKTAMASRSEVDKFTKVMLHGGILDMKDQVKLEEILDPTEDQPNIKCVFVEGAPGVGKSTLAFELCRRWKDSDMEALKKFSLVILLRLREKHVQGIGGIPDLFYHDDTRLKEAVAQEVLKNEGRGVLFVLDGFDEFPVHLRNDCLLLRLIKGVSLPECTVILTSRPSATGALLLECQSQIHKRIEVLGFTQEHIIQFAISTFGLEPETLQDFLKYISISNSPAINSLMYIPLNCAIVAELYKEKRECGKPIPQTMTQLYTELIMYFVKCSQLDKHIADSDSQNLSSNENIKMLAQVAFIGTVNQEVIFDKLPEGCVHFGLVNTMTEFHLGSKGPVSYNFLHLTIQEFLAAFYFSLLPSSEQEDIFNRFCKLDHWNVIWRFVAGLTGFDGIGLQLFVLRKSMFGVRGYSPLVSRLIRIMKEDMAICERSCGNGVGDSGEGVESEETVLIEAFLMHCVYEAQEKADYDSLLGESKHTFYCIARALFDCYVIGYCIASCKRKWDIYIDRLDSDGVEMLMCGLKSRSCCFGSISILCLTCNSIKQEGVCLLRKFPKQVLKQISTLQLHRCSLDDAAIDHLIELLPCLVKLKELRIDRNPITGNKMSVLLLALCQTSLKVLNMRDVEVNQSTVTALTQLTQQSNGLFLDIGRQGMPKEINDALVKALFSSSLLRFLNIKCLNLMSAHLHLLGENGNIEQLCIEFCLYEVAELKNALLENTTLMKLSLGIEDKDDSILEALSDILKLNRTLKILELFGIIDKQVCLALNDVLKHNSNLVHLRLHFLSRSDLTPDEDKQMDSRIILHNI